MASSLFCFRFANSMICSLTRPSTFFSSDSGILGLDPKAVARNVRVSLVCINKKDTLDPQAADGAECLQSFLQ